MEAPIHFSEEAIEFAGQYPNLGPEYHAARAFMERFAESFRDEHLKPMADEITKEVCDKIRDRVWDDFRDHLLSDVEQNAAGQIRAMVEGTVKALLSGEDWAMKRYPLAERYDAEKLREAIAKHIEEPLAKARIEDLESQNRKLKEEVAYWSRR